MTKKEVQKKAVQTLRNLGGALRHARKVTEEYRKWSATYRTEHPLCTMMDIAESPAYRTMVDAGKQVRGIINRQVQPLAMAMTEDERPSLPASPIDTDE